MVPGGEILAMNCTSEYLLGMEQQWNGVIMLESFVFVYDSSSVQGLGKFPRGFSF